MSESEEGSRMFPLERILSYPEIISLR